MRTLLLLLALSCPALCQAVGKQAPIRTNSPFSPNAQVLKDEQGQIIEHGAINGVKYRVYYTDGSGSFLGKKGGTLDWTEYQENWRVGCRKDAMSDEVSCSASVHDLHLSIVNWRGGKFLYVAIIGSNHYPGSKVAIRFDRETPILGGRINGYAFENAETIMARLAKAETVTTRYQKWPYRAPVDRTWEVYGAKEVIDYLKWAVTRIH